MNRKDHVRVTKAFFKAMPNDFSYTDLAGALAVIHRFFIDVIEPSGTEVDE